MSKQQIERLDDFSKILIATGQINYMAAGIEGVNSDIKHMPVCPDTETFRRIRADGIKEREDVLKEAREKLYEVMELLADYQNGSDCICPIDMRVSNNAFAIVSGRKDNVNK